MRGSPLWPFAALFIGAGAALGAAGCVDDTPGDDGGGVEASSCEAGFELSFPDGSSTMLDGCERSTLEATFEFDPDDPPEFRTYTLRFDATIDEGFECSIVIEQAGVCGTGYYEIADGGASVIATTFDCTGVPDDFEGTYAAASGWVRLNELDTGGEPGNFTGDPLVVGLQGEVQLDLGPDFTVAGLFDVSAVINADDAEEQECFAQPDLPGDDDDATDDDDAADDDDLVNDDDSSGT